MPLPSNAARARASSGHDRGGALLPAVPAGTRPPLARLEQKIADDWQISTQRFILATVGIDAVTILRTMFGLAMSAMQGATMIDDVSFYALAVPAVMLFGLAKGGFSGIATLSVPMIALVISPVQAAAILLPILILQDLFSMWAYRRSVDWGVLTRMLPGAGLGILAGYLLAARVDEAAVALAVGAIAIVFALRQLLWPKVTIHAAGPVMDRVQGLFWGAISGFTSMIAHAGGPPFQIYTLPKGMTRNIYAGTTAMFFGLVNWVKVPPYLALGQFNRESLLTAAVLAPVAIVSTLAGVRLVQLVPAERFFRVILYLLLAVGIDLVYDGSSRLLGG